MKRLLLGFSVILAAILLLQWQDWRTEFPGAVCP